ncbi:MAG: LuxR C-terminal-related transcriptional regulator [Bacillota bacterium]|nr:LuxR C-terminal-related transcriptional regulator [Bacillota bacterium]
MTSPDPNNSAWFVATKLHPPVVRNDIIRRPHMEEVLRRSVSTLPLTLLSAPAGYGKTTMLSALPSLLPDYPLAWVTLETEDNDPIRFISLLATVLQRLHPDCGRSVWPLISGGAVSGSGMKHAVGILINDIVQYLPKPIILVLDDLHFVTEPAIHVALDYLLEQRPQNLHVAIGTRHDPPLRLTRLAARRQLSELRRADLSLNQEESHKLLNDTLGLNLSATEVTILQERTEGWPGVLCLLAGPLGRMDTLEDRTQFMTTITHTEQQALDFLAEEILINLPEDIRQFLMQTSILAEMTPSTCQTVTGRDDAPEVLAGLYRRNLAIASLTTETDGEPIYRYHALFARLLTIQLERELPKEKIVELHRRAAEVQKTPGRAISHYFSACLWDQAAQLMVRSGMELLHRGMAATFRQWYGALPSEMRNYYSRLKILMARCEIHRGEYGIAGKLLNEARKAFAAKGDTVGEGDTLTSLITLSYESNDRRSTAKYVKRALELPLNPMGQVAAQLAQAWLYMYDCDWEGACASIRKGLAIPSATGDRRADVIGITYMSAPMASMPGCLEVTESYCAEVSSLALPDTAWYLCAQELGIWPLLWRGQIEEALVRAKTAEDLRQRIGGYPFIGNDLPLLLSVLYLAKGDLGEAERVVDTLVQRVEKTGRSKRMLQIHAAGRSLALLGRSEEALVMQQRLAALDENFPLTEYLLYHLKGLLALLGGDEAEASPALERAANLEVQLPMAHVGGSARLLLARLFLDKGQFDKAFTIACPILREWNNRATPGYALLDGPAILPVLNLASERKDACATRLLHLFSGSLNKVQEFNTVIDNNALKDQLPEPLTPRECDVLRLLIAGRTNIQISTELHVSKETVKSHVAHIFRKLDVHSRTKAAIRARELGF